MNKAELDKVIAMCQEAAELLEGLPGWEVKLARLNVLCVAVQAATWEVEDMISAAAGAAAA